MTTDAAPQPSFEEALKRLEDIVRALETGERSLDESISLYEEGQRLKSLCEARLADARLRIEQIQQSAPGPGSTPGSADAAITTRPFDAQ